MDGLSAANGEQHVDWADPRHGVVEYHQLEEGRLSENVSAESHFTGLQSLQGVFVTIQTSAEDNSYQSMQNDVGYQSVYMSAGADAYQRISPDVDYSVTTDDEGLSMNTKQQFIQIPFVLGGHSQAASSNNQYCTVLNSYLHTLGSSVVNANLTTSGLNDGMTLQNAVSSAVSTHDGQSASLIHMISTTQSSTEPTLLSGSMTPNFNPSGLSSVHTSMLIDDDRVRDDVQGLTSTFNGNCNSSYLHLAMDSSLDQNTSLQSNMSLNAGCNVGLESVMGSNGVRGAGADDVLQQLLADGDDDDNEDDNIGSTNVMEIAHNEISHADNCEIIGTRKSARLANRDNVPSPVQLAKYISQPYNVVELWCEDCQKSYADECPKHKLQPLADKVVLSRAWASLPPTLQIFRLLQPSSDNTVSEMGVFAKRPILQRTQFGPFIAPSVNHPDLLTSRKFLLLVDRDNGSCQYYDAADENLCNWMMFIRPAATFAEQNLVAYQFRNEIYFSTMCNIQTGQELKVWYAAHYAERLQVELLAKPDESTEADIADLPWSCYECSERFRTAALLQNHLSVHDDDVTQDQSADDEVECSRPRSTRKYTNGQLPVEETSQSYDIVPSNTTEAGNDGESSEFQSWKKKKTNMYLKMKKYKGPIKRSIRTLNSKSKSGTIGICCSQCELVFEKRELLDIHSYTHLPSAGPNGLQTSHQADTDCSLSFACPSCPSCFKQMFMLAAHVASHCIQRRQQQRNALNLAGSIRRRPYKCLKCWKSFDVEDKLRQHMMTHTDNVKPLKCDVCDKRFMNNSALSCHKKVHSTQKYYNCALCHVGFDQINMLRAHADQHMDPNTGVFSCPWCHKSFDSFASARRHARAFHSLTSYKCPECNKNFPRPDKLKLHRLSHSSHREFMCETCGRQFKRKDKLREHVKRSHESSSLKPATAPSRSRTAGAAYNQFVPGSKSTYSDYEKLIFKCHDCQLGFKRRGMLINHMAKRHPEVSLASIPELNLPILRSQRDFYCQYCEKVYKSSSKRKAHITKSHPGAELPANAKRRSGLLGSSDVALPNPTYSATVGSVMSEPHACEYCPKQYSTKAKLLQHLRIKHNGGTEQVYNTSNSSTIVHNVQLQGNKVILDTGDSSSSKVLMITRQVNGNNELQLVSHSATSASVAAAGELTDSDILTQAMTELTQSFGTEYRVVATMPNGSTGEYHTIVPCLVNMHSGSATLVQSLSGMESEAGYTTTLLNTANVSQSDQNINWSNMLAGGASFQAFNC